MTAIAVMCWYAWLGLLPQYGWTFWAGNLISAIVFTAFALGEYVGDTLPMIPSRTSAGPLVARLAFGALCGLLGARAVLEPPAGGVIFGVVGALIGAYGGQRLRMVCARWLGRDLPVALCESGLALGLALLAAHQLHITGSWEGLFPR
jgi:uncharacterized membrane protein